MITKYEKMENPDLLVHYRVRYDSSGSRIYEKVSESSISKEVNSYRNTSSLDAVLSRMQFLPINQKIQALNMVEDSAEGDTSIIPKDPTEAFLLMKRYEKYLPKISEELNSGKKLDTILSEIFYPNTDSKPSDKSKSDLKESEVKSDG